MNKHDEKQLPDQAMVPTQWICRPARFSSAPQHAVQFSKSLMRAEQGSKSNLLEDSIKEGLMKVRPGALLLFYTS